MVSSRASARFFVIENSQQIQYYCKKRDYQQIWQCIVPSTTFQHNHPKNFDQITNRVKSGYNVCPVWHAFNGREETAHQNKNRLT